MKSELKSSGAEYSVLEEYKLWHRCGVQLKPVAHIFPAQRIFQNLSEGFTQKQPSCKIGDTTESVIIAKNFQ